ncbi:MAG: PDZ domain-containing protein [Candidatus Peribacteraceae bacterium]|jgi:hypothetical protein
MRFMLHVLIAVFLLSGSISSSVAAQSSSRPSLSFLEYQDPSCPLISQKSSSSKSSLSARERAAARRGAKKATKQSSKSSSSSSIVDVGVLIHKGPNNSSYIAGVTPGGAADQAGLLPADEIRKVNGVEASTRYSATELEALLDGPAGSVITLEIGRVKDGGILTIPLKRVRPISIAPVIVTTSSGVLLVTINAYTTEAGDVLRSALQQVNWNTIKGIIVDIRSSPAGTLEGANRILSAFLQTGVQYGTLMFSDAYKEKISTSLPPVVPTSMLTVLTMSDGFDDLSALFAYALTVKRQAVLLSDKSARGKFDLDGLICFTTRPGLKYLYTEQLNVSPSYSIYSFRKKVDPLPYVDATMVRARATILEDLH